MPTCIWCLSENPEPSLEHIIPDALGCPEGFVLTGGVVCKDCNNGLAHLDQAVIDDFDMQAFLAGVPRKGGRPAAVKTRGNLVATRGGKGPEISINMDRQTRAAHDGSVLGAFGKSKRNVDATLKHEGNVGTVSFSTVVGENPKFARGITKIAFSSLVHFLGPELALKTQFDPVRAYVREGTGQRPILMMASESTGYSNQAWPPYVSEAGEYAVTLRLATAEFLIDLGPTLSSTHQFAEKLTELGGDVGWAWIPAPPDTAQ